MKALNELTPEDHAKLKACIKANPNGCRSADGECGPYDKYGTQPCYVEVGISWEDWDTYFSDEKDRMRAHARNTTLS